MSLKSNAVYVVETSNPSSVIVPSVALQDVGFVEDIEPINASTTVMVKGFNALVHCNEFEFLILKKPL